VGARGLLALWSGKCLIAVLRLVGKNGSTLPGRVALRLDPGLLSALARRTRHGTAVVTGTNGKTTTATMLAEALRRHGWSVAHNRTGANLLSGIATAFIAGASPSGAGRDAAVAEVDEATMPRAARDLGPRLAVVTNFFRDQLDRYGELVTAVSMVRRGLEAMPEGAVAVLNADDPLVAGLGDVGKLRVVFYGAEVAAPAGSAAPADVTRCQRCGAPYHYEERFYAHLGRYRCIRCGVGRPSPHVVLQGVREEGQAGMALQIATPTGPVDVRLPLRGLYNAYNALAAVAAATALGLPRETVKGALEAFSTSFGRMEAVRVNRREVAVALVKNPVGFTEVLRTVIADPRPAKALVVAVNDNYADGTDVSWLWDVDFEQLGERHRDFAGFVASGIRAEDMALRLKYAEVPPGRIRVEHDLPAALEAGLALVPPGGVLYVLPTYTAMLEVRRFMSRRGWARPIWEV
jgi:UDP-N-acetylmuramyl tripeptide synthase